MVQTPVQAPVKPTPVPLSADLVGAPPITLRLPEQWAVDDDRLVELSVLNEMLWIERTAEGALRINFPSGFVVSEHELTIGGQVAMWELGRRSGHTTGPSGGYSLPDGSMLIPDAAWISNERVEGIEIGPDSPMPAAPEFVLEVLSPSHNPQDQQDKMEQWMANGVRLGWLVDPFGAQVWIYREGQDEPQFLERPDTLSGENVMVGLTVDLTRVWPADEG